MESEHLTEVLQGPYTWLGFSYLITGALLLLLFHQIEQPKRARPAEDISSRGLDFLKPTLPYTKVLIQALSNQYSADNPTGCVPLLLSENNISFDILRPTIVGFKDFSPQMANYQSSGGTDALKTALASVMSNKLTNCPVAPAQLVASAGLTAVINELFYCLLEAGDGVLIPTPYYSAFDFDVSAIAKAVPVEVRPKHPLYRLSDELLDEAADRAVTAGHNPKVLLLTNPQNPLGLTYSRQELEQIISWCRRRAIHLVSDEIYGLSVYDDSRPFISVAEVLNNQLGTHVHILWALSKDFCMSGGRCGVIYSQNAKLLQAVETLAMISQMPTAQQEIIAHMLSNNALVDSFIQENKSRLAQAAKKTRQELELLNIPVLPSSAGLFVWVDFRSLLAAPTFDAEAALFQELFEAGVALTPGGSMHAQEPGFFRFCFAWVQPDALDVAMARIRRLAISKGQTVQDRLRK